MIVARRFTTASPALLATGPADCALLAHSAATAEPTAGRGQGNWRVRLATSRLLVDLVNKCVDAAKRVRLPEIGTGATRTSRHPIRTM